MLKLTIIFLVLMFEKIEARLTPGARIGQFNEQSYAKEVAYDGRHLSVFYADHGVELKNMRGALRRSRIGSVFELEVGTKITMTYVEN